MKFFKYIFIQTTPFRRQFCSSSSRTTMKYLNVAEKNDAAKTIASLLSRGNSQRREGLSNYNKIYEFTANVFGQQAQMVMTSVSGHLLNYEFVSTFRGWNSCNPVALFDAPVIKTCLDDYQKIKKTLEREVRSCQTLIIWTDCDREGENIGYEIIKVCQDVKPNIPVYRAKFSEITGPSIFRALNNLERPNKNISDAVDVRQELDLRTGAAFTRLQTLRLQKVFPQKLEGKLISYGSCQFPTLGFVVERYKEIESFIPEPFWRIKMNHTIKDLTVDFHWNRDRLFDKNACQAILDICEENSTATVENVDSKPKSKWRPLPLDTVEMEKSVSRKLKINAKEAMKIAERLYTQGFISYPRTETNIFPKELNLVPLVEQQREDQRWGPFAQRVMNEGGPNPRQGKKSDQAHPPIHPTKYTNSLQGNEQRIYEFIVRHFLACVSKDALGHETVVHVDVAGEKFTAKGLMILERNYLDVYIYEKWNAKEIHQYRNGDTFTPSELMMVESSTTAPKLLTEADLIALMEKHGIGTDATHAEHIDTIKSREYVGLHDNMYFVPGTLGMGLVEGYNNIGLEISLAKPTLRAEFENDLKLICDGLKDPEVVRREQIAKYKAVFSTVVEKILQIDQSLASRLNDVPQAVPDQEQNNQDDYKPVLKCPKCGNDMVLRNRKNNEGKFISCVGYPACKNAVWFTKNVLNIEVLDLRCTSCGPTTRKLKVKFKQNPFPADPNPNIICIGGCDRNVIESLDIPLSSVKSITSSTVATNGNASGASAASTVRQTQTSYRSNDSGYNAHTNVRDNTAVRNSSATNNSRNISRQNTQSNQNTTNLLPPRPNQNRNNYSSQANTSTFNQQTYTVRDDSGNDDDAIVCGCNQEAVLLTVRKDGPNKGRPFYKCQRGTDGGGCNFFLWGDQQNASVNNSATGNSNVMCNCNQPAVLRTVQREGPNTGRQFYTCHKSREEGCGFFKWLDEVDAGGSGDNGYDDRGGGGGSSWGNQSSYSRGRQNARGRGKSTKTRTMPYSSSQPRAKRKCGVCSQEGHNRKNCPNA